MSASYPRSQREVRMVAHGVEVRVAVGPLAYAWLVRHRLAQVRDGGVEPAEVRLAAGEVVEQRAVARSRGEPVADDRLRLLPLARLDMRAGAEVPLPRVDLVRLAGLAADGEHDRAVLRRDGVAQRRRLGEEDARAGGRIQLLAVDREPRAARKHDVELLVAAVLVALAMLLDDLVAGARRRVRVDAEALDAERPAERVPEQLAVEGG